MKREGRYEVSDAGQVRSLLTIRGQTGRDLSIATMKYDYQGVGLYKNGRRASALVHRLVLEAFMGRCPSGEYYHDIARAFGVTRSTARRAVVGIGGWGELDHE